MSRLPVLPRLGFRSTGADGPFGDLVGAHPGVALEGWFWRFTDRAAGRVVLALLGVNRDRDGELWGTVALAAHPGRFQEVAVAPMAAAGRGGVDLRAWDGGRTLLRATDDAVEVDLGPRARLAVRLRGVVGWPRDAVFGGIGPAQLVPGLSQHWHPHVLTAGVAGEATLGDEVVRLDGAVAYAEKNWGAGGFPPAWWWGQAHGFADPGTLVCFAGGRAGVGPVRATATSLVVRLPDVDGTPGEVVRMVRPLQPVAIDHGASGMRLRGRTARWRVDVEVDAPGRAYDLPVPVPAERRNEPSAHQHLDAGMALVVRRGGRVVLRDETALAGFERGTSNA